MDASGFLDGLKRDPRYRGQIVHVESIGAREAHYAKVRGGLDPIVEAAVGRLGIRNLYTHQAEAIERLRSNLNVVIVTSTASGKTLCYTIPVLESFVAKPASTALLMYPTKALAQDQLRALNRLKEKEPALAFVAGTYDGDTPGHLRRSLRDKANILLTNPDMLHHGILPHHGRWSRFFTQLRYVVLDEVHTYRGVFGSHVANVLRRLDRICSHYGSRPLYVCSSATIANPKELAENLTGKPMALVDNDGAPRGPKKFVLWNPPALDASGTDRGSPNTEATHLMTELVKDHIQTITFVRTRLSAEIIFRACREALRDYGPKMTKAIHSYRGGYLPEERRDVERRLATGELLGVASTNALELGIDIGSLDACLIVGYPGTIASMWQEAGRAGRGMEEATVILVAQNSLIDQYLLAHPDYLFGRSPEYAVIDPDNPHIAVAHLRAAAYELPLGDEELRTFGRYAPAVMEILGEGNAVRRIGHSWYLAETAYPAAEVSLRNISGVVYTIMDVSEEEKVIGTIDEISAFSQVHTHAVYLHEAETYFVLQLDIEKKIAFVEKRDLDYYTQAITQSSVKVESTEEESEWRRCRVCFGDVTVTTVIPMFKKVKFYTRDSIGWEQLELPPQTMETVALWIVPPESSLENVRRQGRIPGEGLIGIANVIVAVVPLFAMCDVVDIGAVVDASYLGRDAIFVWDRYPGGMGFAHRTMRLLEEIFQAAYRVVAECPCEGGCPSCVGAAMPPFAHTDLDSATRGRIPDKDAALTILHDLLGLAPYTPKPRGVAAPGPSAKVAPPKATPVERLPHDIARRLRDKLGKSPG